MSCLNWNRAGLLEVSTDIVDDPHLNSMPKNAFYKAAQSSLEECRIWFELVCVSIAAWVDG